MTPIIIMNAKWLRLPKTPLNDSRWFIPAATLPNDSTKANIALPSAVAMMASSTSLIW